MGVAGTCLVGAPVPGGHDGQAEGHSCPWEVPCVGIPEHVHGICAWQVAGGVGDGPGGDGLGICCLQLPITTDLVESWKGWAGQGQFGWVALTLELLLHSFISQIIS